MWLNRNPLGVDCVLSLPELQCWCLCSHEEECCYNQKPAREHIPDSIMDTRAALLTPQNLLLPSPENSPLDLKVTLQKEQERSCRGLAHFQLSEEKHGTTSVSPGSPQLGQWLCSSFVCYLGNPNIFQSLLFSV